MSSDILDRAKAALEGITPAPWTHHVSTPEDTGESHAEWQANTLIGDGEPLHVLAAASDDDRFAYIVPAITGDGPTSGRNADFIAAARTLMPELVAEVEKLRDAAKTLGRIVIRHNEDVLTIVGLQHLFDETGDGPWDVVWEALADMPAKIAKLESEVGLLRWHEFQIRALCEDPFDVLQVEHREGVLADAPVVAVANIQAVMDSASAPDLDAADYDGSDQ